MAKLQKITLRVPDLDCGTCGYPFDAGDWAYEWQEWDIAGPYVFCSKRCAEQAKKARPA